MRIYAVADIHGREPRLALVREVVAAKTPDVVVVAGDITHYTSPAATIAALGALPVPVLAVRGNTDRPHVERWLDEQGNITSLHLREVVLGGVSFVGIGGTIPIPFRSSFAIREGLVRERLASLVKPGSILVAHPPPLGTLDRAFGYFHAGSPGLRQVVAARRPAVVICGHIHESTGAVPLDGTLVVNCAMGRCGAGAMIEIEPGGAPRAEML